MLITLMVTILGFVACESDNFPTAVQNRNIRPTQTDGINVQRIKDSVLIHLDSIYLDTSEYSEIKWYGRIENISGTSFTGSINLYVKLFSDSLHTTILSTPSTWISLIDFNSGEFHFFEIGVRLEKTLLPTTIPDSISIQ